MKKYIIGLDIGGTKISCVVGTGDGQILKRDVMPTEVEKAPEDTMKKAIGKIHKLLQSSRVELSDVEGIGVGAPGPLDPISGTILATPNMPGWNGVCLKEILGKEFGLPVVIDNDANAAALGEKKFGAGKEVNDLFYFTVSTGIGGGLIIDGRIYHGASFDAAEVGHMTILPDGPRCGCGKLGCLEALASGTAIARRAKEKIKGNPASLILKLAGDEIEAITAKVVAEAASKGDKLATLIWEEAARFLGIGVANVLNLINPQMVIIGGGVAKAGELLFKPVRESAAREAFGRTFESCKIVPSALGDMVGDFGAISLVP